MEKSLLESKLEEYLQSIGMSLGERIYAEDKDFQAELENIITPKKYLSTPEGILFGRVFGYVSEEQVMQKRQSFIDRHSLIYNGLGFRYFILSDMPPRAKSVKEISDKSIKSRKIGNNALEEILWIFYNEEFRNSEIKSRRVKIEDSFYKKTQIPQFGLSVLSNYKIKVDNFTRKERNYKGCKIFANIFKVIEKEFQEKILNEDNSNELMSYLGELKKLAE